MTETAVQENAENAEGTTPEVEETPGVPTLAKIEDADTFTQNTFPILVGAINAYNEIATKNNSKTKGVDEIVADLKETSQDPKVVALRAKRDELEEQIAKMVTAEAKALKENVGEPDLEAEKNAKAAVDGLLKAVRSFPDGKRIDHFLPEIVKGASTRVNTGGNSGPKNDLSAVREWAKQNGYPDVKDRGRMSDEILDAYAKAHTS